MLGHEWQTRGIQSGQRVALWGLSGPELALAFWSLWQVGAITRPLNPRFPPALLGHLVQDCHFYLSPSACFPGPAGPGSEARSRWSDSGVLRETLAKAMQDSEHELLVLPPPQLSSEQALTEILTSGSSGNPKAALHTWGNHRISAEGALAAIPLQPGDLWLAALPLFHVGGLALLIRTALAGAAVAFPSETQSLAAALNAFQPTHLSLVPTQLHRLLEHPELLPALRCCKAILLGGSAIPPALIEKALACGLRIHCSYGSTEMSSQICTTQPGAALAELLTAGSVLPGRELKISEQGEIWVRGGTRFQGYITPSGLECPFDSDGWFATGDLGRMTPQGWLQVNGRKDHRFISGGENIQPEAIELALLRQPEIVRALVVPVSDLEFGQRPVAFIETLEPVSKEELNAQLRYDLPGFMLPVAYFDWPTDPEQGWKPSRLNLKLLAEQLFHRT